MKPVDVNQVHILTLVKKSVIFKIGAIVRILKVFAKGHISNWSEEVFVIKKVKSTVPWTYVISDLKSAEIVGKFYEKEFQKANLKSKVDQLDFDKLVPLPVDLSNLSDAVKNYVVKKDVYNAKIKNIDDETHDITNLATNTTLNFKINEVKGEIASITNLATTTALTAAENKIPNVSNLVKKSDYKTKTSETENEITTDHDYDKYITTQEFHKLNYKKKC